MWIKHYADGTKKSQGQKTGTTWLTTPLDSIVKVELVLPENLFQSRSRFFLSGPGPYHHATRAQSAPGYPRPIVLGEYIQRFNGNAWLTIEADYQTGAVKQYLLKNKLGA